MIVDPVRIALITGASSGIGLAIAREFAGHGIHVILVARRSELLEAYCHEIRANGGKADFLPVDLSDEKQRNKLKDNLTEKHWKVDYLINNAGFGWYGFLKNMPWEEASSLIEVNIKAVVHLTCLFLPDMIASDYGRIINIGSIAGDIPSQGIALYAASKSFINAFTTSIHRELTGSGVTITNIKPGPVKTEFFDRSEERNSSRRIPAEIFSIKSEIVARAVWKIVKNPRRQIYIPWFASIIPAIELIFGSLMDRLGPLLLNPLNKRGYPSKG
jgi:short-subunit dehydrogenase